MIPTILRDQVALRAGYLHTNFQRTGLTRTFRVMKFQPPAEFSVLTEAGGRFTLQGPDGAIESFFREKEALSAMKRVANVLAADPEGRWTARRRYTWLIAGAFLALSAGATMLNATSPAVQGGASATGYVVPPQVIAPYSPAAVTTSPSGMDGAANATPPTKRGIHFGKVDAPPEKTLYVFSDPQCPHCRDLERTLAGMPADFSVNVFPTPFLPGAEDLTAKINCAPDPRKAWRDALAGRAVDGSGACDKSGWGKENVSFFRSVGLTATPTIVAGIDGRIRTGSTDLTTLINWMKAK